MCVDSQSQSWEYPGSNYSPPDAEGTLLWITHL